MIARLERNYEQRVLTLIVAPARYGKRSRVSMWLDVSETRGSWVSLDAENDDLRTFLTYVVAAILSVFPDVSLRVQSMLEAPAYPPPLTIARTLLNDLEQLPRRIVIIQSLLKFVANTRFLVVIPIVGLVFLAAALFVVGGIRLVGFAFDLVVGQGETSDQVIYEIVEFIHFFLIVTVLYCTAKSLAKSQKSWWTIRQAVRRTGCERNSNHEKSCR